MNSMPMDASGMTAICEQLARHLRQQADDLLTLPNGLELALMAQFHFSNSEAREAARLIESGEITWMR